LELKFAAVPLLGLLCLAPALGLASTASFDGLDGATLDALAGVEDDYDNLSFDQAEALALSLIAKQPSHCLPRIYLQAACLARVQDLVETGRKDPAAFERFGAATADALSMAQARLASDPGPIAYLYLGNCLGGRGLVKLYQGHYVSAYRDGEKADQALKKSVELDPSLYSAWFGLGQYEYYCAHLAGILRLILGLHGDEAKGIALLEGCVAHPNFASTSAMQCLARIDTLEHPDFEKALPYVAELQRRFPRNYDFQRYALAEAAGLGLERPEARSLLLNACALWDKGWRPPAKIPFPLPELRNALDKAKNAQASLHRAP
jgi:tetratricopeptide (TPR) repeat protein